VALLTVAALSTAAEAHKSVLLVFDEDKDLPGLALINASVQEVFKTALRGDVQFYSESLALSQFRDQGYDDALLDHYRRKYAGKHLDLVVAVMEPSLHFLLRHRGSLFPGLPIVFCGIDSSDIEGTLPKDVTGVLIKRTFAPTLDIALRAQPDTRNVFVVSGTTRFDQRLLAIARRDFEPFRDRAVISYLAGQPMDDLLRTLSQLPPRSVILYLTLFADGAGHAFSPHEALSRIAGVANAPVYVSLDQYVGLGAVGGHAYSIAAHGRHAAEIGLRILRGESASSIPAVEEDDYENMFDWRQLKRWGIEEARLPADSVLSFRTPSVWDLYKWYITAGVMLFILQTTLVVGLLVSRAERRRADSAARDSEARRRRAEEEVQRQRDELAHALRVTTLGELTASFAHEIGQPLTAILANAQAARRMLAADPANKTELDETLVDISLDSNRAVEIIRRLRALFRKERAERAAVNVNALIDDVLALLGTETRAKDIAVRVESGENLPPVLGDPVQLRQVILNLLVNATEAIVADGGPREIRIETRRPEAGRVAIDLRDSGAGARESELERIFEHFVSSKPNGLGMGLAISRSIVEAHGGRIWATRNHDRGLTLHLELPAAPGMQRDVGEARRRV